MIHPLDDATALLERPTDALEALLVAWRACRAPEIEARIATQAARLPSEVHAITHRKHWDATFAKRTAATLPALLASLESRLPWAPERFAHLIDAAADPRIVRLLSDWIALVPDGDRPRVAAWLAAHPPQPLDDETRAALARYDEAWEARVAAEHRLLVEVRAAPDENGPRQVYGDWLLERGDPRGEFVALQFRKNAKNEIAIKREAKLRAAYDRVWLGGLRHPTVVPTTFERGFITVVELRPGDLTALVGAADWGTVREIILYRYGIDLVSLAAVLGDPVMRTLQKLGPLSLDNLAALRDTSLPVTTLVVDGDRRRDEPFPALAETPHLAHVRRVEVRGSVRWLLHSDLLPRLTSLRASRDRWANGAALDELRAIAPVAYPNLTLEII